MLGDLSWYAQHVRRFSCEDITIGVQEVDKHAFLFGQELGPDPHCLGLVSGSTPTTLVSSSGWKSIKEVGLL